MTSDMTSPAGGPVPGVPRTDLRGTVERFWATAEARDWTAFESTLAEDVVYTLPQTRERITGRDVYVRFNREYPGDWHVRTERIVSEPDQVVTWMRVTVGPEEMHAVSFFTGDGYGRIATVTDFWPEPYEPPAGRDHLTERY
ncbi:nuclear transport factor 2 family protein [Streptomyces sp. NPDC046862]|uniref:nuclear transport factor 2 family protein n=1 Tax=Streptomyces sp. NPDC046862 TaxID=3154603 RepID=UPI003454E681